jgi:hypothetical protein
LSNGSRRLETDPRERQLEQFFSVNQKAKVYLREVEPADRYFRAFMLLKRAIGIDYSLCHQLRPSRVSVSVQPASLVPAPPG